MSNLATLTPFDEIENSDEFKALPLKDQLTVIDGWADEVIESNGYAESKEVVDFTEKVKSDYKARAISDVISKKLPRVVEGALTQSDLDARKADAETMFQGAFNDALRQKDLNERKFEGGTISASTPAAIKFEAQDPELSGMITDLLFDDKTRKSTQPVDLDLGDGVKIKASRIAHPGKDLFEFVLPGGKRVVEESPDMSTAAKAAVEKNLDAFPDTGGDIIARLGQGVLEDSLIKSGEGAAALAGMVLTRALLAPDVLGAGMAGRVTGSYPETMAPLVEATRQIQASVIEKTRADTLNAIVDRIAPVNPQSTAETFVGQGNNITRQLPRAIGQGVGNIAIGLVTGGAAPGVLFAINVAAMGNQAAEEAVAAGKPEEAMSAFLETGLAGGAVETATDLFFTKAFKTAFGRSLDISSPGASARLAKRFKEGLSAAGLGGAQEGVAEGVQTAIANDVARRHYDENRSLFKGVNESAAIGALTGFILGGGSGAVGVGKEAIAISREKKTTNEETLQQTETGQTETGQASQVNESASVSEPEVDDAPVRSVIEEFANEEPDAEIAPVETPPIPEVGAETVGAPIPPSPVEEISPVEEPAPVTEVQPAPLPEVDEEVNTPDATESAVEPVQTFEVDDALSVNIYQNNDGTTRVEKVNTETGQTIPLEGAEQSFPSYPDAVDFYKKTFTPEEKPVEVIPKTKEEIEAFTETDPLMLWLTTNPVSPVQDNIKEIGNVARRKDKGLRAMGSDQSGRATFDDVPLVGDYTGLAQERLRKIYKRGSAMSADVAATRIFEQNPDLIAGPFANDLWDAVKQRLQKVGGEKQITSGEQAEIAVDDNNANLERDYTNFMRDLKSPYRRGGLIEAGALQIGDVLEVAGSPATVTSRDDDGIAINSKKYGEITVGLDERIGYDSMAENGIPATERENLAAEDRVSREEAASLTNFLQEKLADPSITAVPSREHSALAKNKVELEAARRLARLFNRRVVGVRNLPANGAVSRADNQNIYIAVDSSRTELLIVAHEMLHQMRQTEPDLYQDLIDTLDADLEAYVAEKRNKHSDKSLEMLQEEFLADYLSDRSADPAFWESLAVRNPDLFERFVDFIRQFLAGIRERILSERMGVERFLRDQAAMQRTMEDVLVAFKARQSQDRRGILDVPLDESMPFADVRFADQRQDTEYLAAVEAGDSGSDNLTQLLRDAPKEQRQAVMDAWVQRNPKAAAELQRMVDEAAMRAGYNIGPVWRGDSGVKRSNTLNPNRLKDAYDNGPATLFATNKKLADFYDENNDARPFYLRIPKLRRDAAYRDANRAGHWSSIRPVVLQAKDQKYDGVFIENISDGPGIRSDIFGSFNSEQHKLALPVTYDESGNVIPPSQRFNPASDDIRFADQRKTKVNQDVVGQKIGRPDEIQGQEELQKTIRSQYFDGTAEITPESREEAFWLINEMLEGTFDASQETGLDAAGSVLNGELWNFANRMMAAGDSTLYERMKAESNDYNGRERTKAGRVLNAAQWYTREVDQAAAEINKAKREIITDNTGDPQASTVIKEMQRELDALKVTLEQLEAADKEKSDKLDAFIQGKAGAGAASNTETLTKQLTGGKKGGAKTRATVEKFENFLKNTFGDIRFSDERLTETDRNEMVARWVREQATAKHKKRAVFIRNLMEAGRTREFAEEMFLRAAEFRAEIAESLKADSVEKQETPPEKTTAEKASEAINAESVRIDKLNRKVEKAAERYEKGAKKRNPSGKQKENWEKTVERLLSNRETFNREQAVKDLLMSGMRTEYAAKLATAIEVKIKNEAVKKSTATPAEKAREIIDRYKNPIAAKLRDKSPIRKLINDALKKGSTVTQADFMESARLAGIPANEASSMWTDIVDLRDIRQQIRNGLEAQRKAKAEAKANQEQAKRIIEKLENPQDPASSRVKRTTEKRYEEMFRNDRPTHTREEFVRELVKANVDPETANRLYDLALKEKARREAERKETAARKFIDKRSIAAIKREILAHPSLKIVGPAERLAIMARLIEDRAGLLPVDALAAAKMFDEMVTARWDTAGQEIAEEVASRRNAPYFRKPPSGVKNQNRKTSFDKLQEAIRAGALDPSKRVLDEVAKANGWVDLTATELSELARLDALLDDPDITEFEQIRYKREMLKIYQLSAIPPSVWKVVSETFIANIFSGPSTMLIGIWAMADSIGTVPRDFIVSAIGSANKGGKLADSRNLTGFGVAIQQGAKNFTAALSDAAVTFRTGDMRNVMADELATSIGNLDRVWAREVPILKNPTTSRARKARALTTLLLTSARWGLRVLAAADSFTRGVNRRFQTELELFSRAGNLGWDKKRIKALIASVAVETEHFSKLADEKGFKGTDKSAFVNDKLANAMYAAFAGEKVLMASDTIERATREANLPTGMGEIQIGTAMLPGALAMGAKFVSQKGGLIGRVAVPVVQTPYNAFHRGIWYTPYAFIRLLGTAVHTKGFRNWDKTHYPEALADPVQLALRATEAALGNAVLGALATTIIGQMLEEDEEKRCLWISLSGPTAANGATMAERGAWLSSGRRPFTLQLKMGGERITVAFRRGGLEPFNFAFTLFGALDQMKYEKGGYESVTEKYAYVLLKETTGESMFFLRSFLSRGFGMDRGRMGAQAGYYLSGFVPWASMLKTPNRFDDLTQRPEGFWANVAWQMPLVPQMKGGEPALNALGQPAGFNENAPFYMLSRVGIPAGAVPNRTPNRTTTRPTYDDVLSLLRDKDSFPSDARKSDVDEAAGRETTPTEFRDFQKARGDMLLKFLTENYQELWNVDAERFNEILGDKSRDITKRVKRSMGLYGKGE